MRVSLVVHRVNASAETNLETILQRVADAASAGSDLVMFSEAAITGLINDDNPSHDLALGTPVPGPISDQLGAHAQRHNINVALGLFELDGQRLFDTALFISRQGTVDLKYRRISPDWHDPGASLDIYAVGTSVKTYQSDIGSICFLMCGDLFDDELVTAVRREHPDLLLVPFARSFYGGGHSQERWGREEQKQYLDQVKRVHATTLLVNYLDDEYFGGAFAVDSEGNILSSIKLGHDDIMTLDV